VEFKFVLIGKYAQFKDSHGCLSGLKRSVLPKTIIYYTKIWHIKSSDPLLINLLLCVTLQERWVESQNSSFFHFATQKTWKSLQEINVRTSSHSNIKQNLGKKNTNNCFVYHLWSCLKTPDAITDDITGLCLNLHISGFRWDLFQVHNTDLSAFWPKWHHRWTFKLSDIPL